jgi:tRNA(Arg) A34 adenosine deaminase TadA
MATDLDRGFMLKAIDLMRKAGVLEKTGGPFGAVIVKGGKIVAAGGNRVLADKDPTAHAEVTAIRNACKNLGTHILSGAVMYTSCACCPLCYAAAYWARIDKIFYGAECDDYKDIFDDSAMYIDFELPFHKRKLKPEQLCRAEANVVWDEFRKLPDGARY